MVKEQKRSNREVKKPKATKASAPAAGATSAIKGSLTPVTTSKKKP